MPVVINDILGEKGFLAVGDEILSIGGREVEDQLDIIYHTSGSGSADFVIRRKNGKVITKRISMETFHRYQPLFEEMSFITCRSKCKFCFVDQMAPGLRKTLYLKDDDYRLSFLFGNYVTLNDITDEEIARIIEYRLSPIYVSVHSTDLRKREELFGRPLERSIVDILKILTASGIVVHAQAVLVPGINDGPVAIKTSDDLFQLYPMCKSLALVPVGLTRHRKGLPELRRFKKREAFDLIERVEIKQQEYKDRTGGDPFVFPSDEFYLLSGIIFPSAGEYRDFDQVSNGVGMSRLFVDEIREAAIDLAKKRISPFSMLVVTGGLGDILVSRYIAPILEEYIPSHDIAFVKVRNRLFGNMVTVSGLLSGSDIIKAVRETGMMDRPVILPPNCVNHNGRFLDDMTVSDLKTELGIKVIVPESNFLEKEVVKNCKIIGAG
ncbi:MAG: DUF512 domain-containing protein [Candidatus Krumholzibacteriota bacterium]|nr:DUF512 domain-containing protein [Candidatus Krumholzibacteriota bacterium]